MKVSLKNLRNLVAGVRTQLMLLVLVTALPLMLSSLLMYNRLVANARESIRQSLLVSANTLAGLVDSEIDTHVAIEMDGFGAGVRYLVDPAVVRSALEALSNVGAGIWCDTDCFRIDYADNFVAHNTAIGIFHEISFDATIHGNQLRWNGVADSEWFWGADILLAGSRNVRVTENRIEVAPERCAIVLIDQNRSEERGESAL